MTACRALVVAQLLHLESDNSVQGDLQCTSTAREATPISGNVDLRHDARVHQAQGLHPRGRSFAASMGSVIAVGGEKGHACFSLPRNFAVPDALSPRERGSRGTAEDILISAKSIEQTREPPRCISSTSGTPGRHYDTVPPGDDRDKWDDPGRGEGLGPCGRDRGKNRVPDGRSGRMRRSVTAGVPQKPLPISGMSHCSGPQGWGI